MAAFIPCLFGRANITNAWILVVILVNIFTVLFLFTDLWLDDFALENAHGVVVIQCNQIFITQYQILNLSVS